jgi:hypothetical protein
MEKGAPGHRCFSDLDFRLRPGPPKGPGINDLRRGVLTPWNFLRAARGHEEGRFASTLWLHHTTNHVSIDYILLSHLVVQV